MLTKKADEFFKPKKTRNKKVADKVVEKVVEEIKIPEAEIKKLNGPLLRRVTLSVLLLIFLGLVGATVYFYQQYKKAVANPSAVTQDEVKDISEKIGKFMELPIETPTLATVSDKEKLQGQAFFTNAQNGDKVLIYSKSQKAILWRPLTGKIIEVTSLSVSNQDKVNLTTPQDQEAAAPQAVTSDQTPEASPTQNEVATSSNQPAQEVKAEKVRVSIYNGTTIKGFAVTLAGKILALENTEVTQKTNATGNYTKTIVVDLSGKNAEVAQKVAQAVSGEVSALPNEETKPDADILVIGGGK